MLDLRRIRQNPEELITAMERRNFTGVDVRDFLAKEAERRALMTEADALKARRNEVSAQIPKMKKAGEDTTALMAEMKEVGARIKELDAQIIEYDALIGETLLSIPNIPNADIPTGPDDTFNVEVRRWGEPRKFDFEPKAHWDIGTDLDILDFETGAKVTGTRFTFYKGMGAKLERACLNFFLDHNTDHGFTEVFPPFIANESSMRGTGQLPKFKQDMFKLEGLDYYLIPTAEVPITNMLRDSVVQAADLPIYYSGYSACFRAEAGSAGRDTRGLIRQHQFNKVEMVKFTKPEESYAELETLTACAESILQTLGLPYRVVCLSSGDIGFSSAKTYDVEVWMPSYGRYVEISSCSNFEDFQARRANIRFRDTDGKLKLVHTLNGSGIPGGRTVAAILENYQNADGTVTIPDALVPYLRGVTKLG